MTSTPLNLTLLNDGVASQRVMLPQTTPFHLNAVAGNRYLITQGSQDKALGPKQLKFSRKGRNLEIYGAEDEQPQLIILDYFAQPGDVLGVDASGELHTYVSASDAGLNAAAFADNQQAVMMMSEASGGPLAAFYPADNYGFLRAASAFAGLLALGGGILAMQNQHGGSDKGPPAPPSIIQGHDDFGTVTGVLQSGAVTNNASPDISGQGSQPGHLVHIYANGMMQGSAMVGEDGSWTFSLSGLAEGRHHLTATESSANGKMSAESAHFELHVDLTPPAVALDGITDNVGTLTGLIPSGGLTNDSAPQLSGQSEPGARVEITVDGRVVGSTVADEAGNWRFTLPSQADGGHRISVTATDAVGNTSAATADYLIVVDTIAPVARISDALDNVAGGLEDGASVANGGLTNDNRPVLRGTAEAGSLVMIYDGSTAIGSFTATGDAWEFPFTDALSDGEHTFSIVVTDPAGNSTTSASYVLNVDTIAPEAVITGVLDNVAGGTESGGNIASGGLTNDSQPVLRGVAEAGSLVVIFDGLTAIASFTATSDVWEFQLAAALSEGEHTLKIQVTDPAGNATLSDPYLIHVDTQVARPVIASVTDAVTGGVEGAIANDGTGLTNDGRPVLAGTAEAGSLVTIYDGATAIGSVRADATGAWRWQHPAGQQFADGAHVLTVRAVDPAGNVSVASQGFTLSVDTQVARPVIASVTDAVTGGVEGAIANDGTGLTNDGRPVLAGTAESGSLVTIYDGATAIGSVRADTTGAWRWQHPAGERFADGAHVLTVRAVDPAGNVSVASQGFTLSVDTQIARPVIASVTDAVTGGVEGAIANDGTGLTNDGRPVLAGTSEAGSLVTIYDGATAIGSVRADATGAWRWQHPAGERFADGAHVLTVQAVDPAGNVSVASGSFTLSVDTQVARPVIASVTDAVTGGVEGAIANDGTGLTNDGRPVLAGTAEAGSLATIYDGATAIASFTTTTANWTWQHPAGERFADGAHVLTVRAVDPAGNTSVLSESFTINVDTQTPRPVLASVTDAVAGGVTGAIANDGTGLTNDGRPVLAGTAEADSLVTIYDGATAIGSVRADTTGAWRWQHPAGQQFADGAHVLTVQAVDPAGNVSVASQGFTISVDTQVARPVIASVTDAVTGGVEGAIANDGTGLTNDGRPVLAGTAEAGSLITIYDGATAIGSVRADATGAWRWQHPAGQQFADGAHVLTVRAVDPAGNVSVASQGFTLSVDTQVARPVIASVTDAVTGGVEGAIANDGTGLTNDDRPVLAGTAEAGSLITIYDGATAIGSVRADTTGAWRWQHPAGEWFADGAHVLTVRAVDPAGNVSVASQGFTLSVDTQIARPVIASVTDAVTGGVEGAIANDGTGLTNDDRPVLAGTAEAGSLITIYDGATAIGSVRADTTGAWRWQHPAGERFADGAHVLTVRAVDPAGNVSVASGSFTLSVDTQVARPVIASVTDAVTGGVEGAIANDGTGLTNDGRPVLAGTAEAGSLVTIYDGATAIGSVRADTTGAWRWQHPAGERFADGAHVLTVRAVDPAGNVSVASQGFTLSVDTQVARPVIASVTDAVTGGVEGAIANDGTGLTNDGRPVLAGTAESGSLVTIYDGATAIGSVLAHATTGAWRWQHPAGQQFADGAHVLTVQVLDKAGNLSSASESFVINVDSLAPVAPEITVGTDDVGALTESILKGRITDDTTPTFSGKAEPNSLVFLFDNDVLLGSFNADDSGDWRWELPELLPGMHNLTAYSVDAAGNRSALSEGYDFKVGTVWDFNDGTFDGWRILGDHRNPGNTFTRPTAGGGYQLEFITIGGGTYGGDIMSREINVVVGETYDFNFILSRITSYALINPAQLALMVDGVAVSAYYTVQDSPQKVEGSWMATRTGTVTLAINNRVSTGSGNDFWIDDIAIALHKPAEPSAGPTALLLSPEIDLPVENSHFIDMTQQAMSSIDLSIHDVLTQGATDLFINDGKVQLMVSGDEGRQLILSDLLPDGSDNGDWTNVGNVRVAGVEYHVYHHSGYDAELLVSLAIQTTLDNH